MNKKILKCNNCDYETYESELIKEKNCHACWLDQKNDKCKIIGYKQEGVFLYKRN